MLNLRFANVQVSELPGAFHKYVWLQRIEHPADFWLYLWGSPYTVTLGTTVTEIPIISTFASFSQIMPFVREHIL